VLHRWRQQVTLRIISRLDQTTQSATGRLRQVFQLPFLRVRAETQAGRSFKCLAAIFCSWMAGFLPLEAGPIWIPTAQIRHGVRTVAVGIVSPM
jgi:hypothetical protein